MFLDLDILYYIDSLGAWGGSQDFCGKSEKQMEKERTRKLTSSGVAKTQPLSLEYI